MPIRPENKARYPANWKHIRENIAIAALALMPSLVVFGYAICCALKGGE